MTFTLSPPLPCSRIMPFLYRSLRNWMLSVDLHPPTRVMFHSISSGKPFKVAYALKILNNIYLKSERQRKTSAGKGVALQSGQHPHRL